MFFQNCWVKSNACKGDQIFVPQFTLLSERELTYIHKTLALFVCLIKLPFELKKLWQISHFNGFLFSCTVLLWVFISPFYLNELCKVHFEWLFIFIVFDMFYQIVFPICQVDTNCTFESGNVMRSILTFTKIFFVFKLISRDF